MEVYCSLIPAIGSLILTVLAFLSCLNKENETIWRAWCFIFGVVLSLFTTFFFNLGAKEVQRYNRQYNYHEYYDDYHVY
jgi:predicted PurR-regulated permease PerM